ncbi:MAG: hypothetical protein IJS09_00540, partial [Treponema sp.]|nr:hypothetical protein [Treponema sp.]
MKKIISKTTSLFLALTACMFMSCNDVIFSTILDEVKLESAQVSGDINSIVRYTCDDKEYLYLDNGNVWRKDMTQT